MIGGQGDELASGPGPGATSSHGRRRRRPPPAAPRAASAAGTPGPPTHGAVEAGPFLGVAGRLTVLVHQYEQGVPVAVDPDLAHVLAVARGLPLAPELLATAAPEPGPAGGQGATERLLVHIGHGEHLAADGVLHHRR